MAETTERPEWAPAVRTTLERRKAPRSPFVVRVQYATVDALFSEFARNVNEGGLFIETQDPPPPETRVALQFELPGSSEVLQTEGRVAWIHPGSEHEPAGMGIEFENLSAADRARINDLVRRLRASDADDSPAPDA